MAEGAQSFQYPPVYVVDSHTSYPPLPPKSKPLERSLGVAQILLFFLVSLALCGMAIEACFIYRLYHPDSVTSSSGSTHFSVQDKQDIRVSPPTKKPNSIVLPSKPVAHLNAGPNQHPNVDRMQWNTDSMPLLYQMMYSDGQLTIQREGYYYVYSKVFYNESNHGFIHSVCIITPKYGKKIPFLQSRRYYPFSKPGRDSISTSNSFLGGVVHLNKDDSLVVVVSNMSQITIAYAYENFFGAYML